MKNLLKIWDLRKKINPIEVWKVINIAKASGIKIVEGENMKKIVNSDSKYIESVVLDLDKPEEHQALV